MAMPKSSGSGARTRFENLRDWFEIVLQASLHAVIEAAGV